ncbi:MAG: hypothetical protein IT165_16170 [Bryobacterales bacterium]|nr:hypothetical protein [Bryobacterales bacterium]
MTNRSSRAEPDLPNLLTGLRQTARRAIAWGDRHIDDDAYRGDPRWECAWWTLTSLLPRLEALEMEARRLERMP